MIRREFSLGFVFLLAACAGGTSQREVAFPREFTTDAGSELQIRSWSDDVNHEIVLVAGPFSVPAAVGDAEGAHHNHNHPSESMVTPLIPLRWPVDAGMQGFRLAVFTADGTKLPRDIIHHMIAVNFSRSQLVYPVPERLFGFGSETPDITLPDRYEVPLERGDSIGMYAMWNNQTGQDLEAIYLKVVIPYAAPGRKREAVMPIYMDTNNRIGGTNTFALPPGLHSQSYEFELPVSGGLLAAGGHLHDYGIELRLEDVETGEILFRLESERTPDGRVLGVEQKIFRRLFKIIDARIELEAGRRYRVVGVYDNPTGKIIPDGGMAHIVGLFAPDDMSDWPLLDPTRSEYAIDVQNLPKIFEGSVQEVSLEEEHEHRAGERQLGEHH